MLRTSEEKIYKTLFSTVPFSYVLFAENAAREVGFALYGFRYSSFAGQPSIWLDDLYVDEAMRSKGAGAALMSHLAGVASENACTHIAWHADARNVLAWHADARNVRGLHFYHRLGAEIVEQSGNRCLLKWMPRTASEEAID